MSKTSPHPDQSKILRGDRVLVTLADGSTKTMSASKDADGESVTGWTGTYPRESCTRLLPLCNQCGVEMAAPIVREIRENRANVQRTFCSDRCGGHYQMGCEG